MAMISAPVGDGEAPPGTVRLGRDAMETLGVADGDTVAVGGESRTVARVGGPIDSPGVVAHESVLQNAGLAVGEQATVEATEAGEAAAVVLAPPEGFGFQGGADAIADRLRGLPVTRGDGVTVGLLGGSLEVTFTVAEVTPTDPGVVTAETAVRLGEPAGATTARLLESTPSATYDDLGGLDDELRRLRRLVEVPLERPALFDELGGHAPNGVLVYGQSGAGKTLLASAVGNETDARFLHVPDPEAVDQQYDEGFASLAETARREAPAVVLVDDVEAVAPADGGATRFRSFLDAVAPADVVVVGTTDSPDDVDPSLRRGGRFDYELEVGAPDRAGRREILAIHTAGVPLADGVDLGSVAAETHGYVGADLLALVGEAVQRAVERLPEGVQFGDDEPEAVAVTAADFEAALERVTPSGMREVRIEQPSVTYTDIGGAEAAKREIIRAVEWPLRYPELFEKLGTEPPTGVLLHGLPGTGKTMLARAVANATSANFVPVDGPELLNRYVGESERGVREVFERARQQAPAVVFFDEVDALAPARGDDAGGEVLDRVVSQLLTELDGIEPRGDVVVVGATNRPDMIDPALLRPGRLEKVVEVPMPDRAAREEIFEVHCRDRSIEGVDIGALAERTEGYTGSDIAAVVREATLLAMEGFLREHSFDPGTGDPDGIAVTGDHFEEALEVVTPSVSPEMQERYRERADDLGR